MIVLNFFENINCFEKESKAY